VVDPRWSLRSRRAWLGSPSARRYAMAMVMVMMMVLEHKSGFRTRTRGPGAAVVDGAFNHLPFHFIRFSSSLAFFWRCAISAHLALCNPRFLFFYLLSLLFKPGLPREDAGRASLQSQLAGRWLPPLHAPPRRVKGPFGPSIARLVILLRPILSPSSPSSSFIFLLFPSPPSSFSFCMFCFFYSSQFKQAKSRERSSGVRRQQRAPPCHNLGAHARRSPRRSHGL